MDVKQQQRLKGIAHNLKPVVLMGDKGLTENVMLEIDMALATHQLIKVKAAKVPKDIKKVMAAEIYNKTRAELVQLIGNILVLYRKNPTKDKI